MQTHHTSVLMLVNTPFTLVTKVRPSQKRLFNMFWKTTPACNNIFPKEIGPVLQNEMLQIPQRNLEITYFACNRICLVTGSSRELFQNNTVLICFGNSSNNIKKKIKHTTRLAKSAPIGFLSRPRERVSTIRWLSLTHCPKMSQETQSYIMDICIWQETAFGLISF